MNAKTLDLLKSAKKDEPKPEALEYTSEEAKTRAAHYLAYLAADKVSKEARGKLNVELLDEVTPWHLAQCRAQDEVASSVKIPTANGDLRITFQDRYHKIPMKCESKLRAAAGDEYDLLFHLVFGLTVKKAISDDTATLGKMVNALTRLIGKDKFEEWFDVDISIAPTKTFTLTKHRLDPDKLAALEDAGVDQVVVLAAAK